MHPILTQWKLLGLYLVAWAPTGVLLAAALVFSTNSSWTEALLLANLLTLVYAFLCLGAWYPCRALPLQRSTLVQSLGTHLATAAVSSGILVALASGLAWLLGYSNLFSEALVHIKQTTPLLFTIGILLYLLSVAIHYLLISFEKARASERRILQAELAAKESQLLALKAQLDPHFLFNSLNSISSFITSNTKAARKMCIELGDFFRLGLQHGLKTTIPLEDELSLVRRFLAMEKVRFGSRLEIQEEIDPSCDTCPVPPLLLQPLVENALKHGISQCLEGGCLTIGTQLEANRVRLYVENPIEPDSKGKKGTGLGLSNVRERLHSLYDNRARLKILKKESSYRVEVVLPFYKSVNNQEEPNEK